MGLLEKHGAVMLEAQLRPLPEKNVFFSIKNKDGSSCLLAA
jgi:hypothetical protein